ncbi:hypothetical protein [Stenotrophomonas humi]|uniref:hypothetical protein n=1 Tax=Stenotrophomonas humi TaxID=405444 RepID=UPI00137A3EE3|nr:hypothetical protein [Stenotrophomonas humi]
MKLIAHCHRKKPDHRMSAALFLAMRRLGSYHSRRRRGARGDRKRSRQPTRPSSPALPGLFACLRVKGAFA